MQNQSSLKLLGDNYLLLLIILLGAALRLYDLGGESVWFDEAYTINISKYDPVGIIKEILRDNENHPPLYYSTMHYWIKLFGDSAYSVRFPSVIFGVLSILAIYKTAILLFNKNTALLSALVLSTSVFLIELSQEARSYSLLGLLSIVSFYYFTKLFTTKSLLTSLFYLLSSLLLISTHYYGAFILIAQSVFFLTLYLFSTKPRALTLTRWLVLQLTLLILFLPHFYLIAHAAAVKTGLWMSTPDITVLPGAFLSYSGSFPIFILFVILAAAIVFNFGALMRVKSLNQYLNSLSDKPGSSGLTYLETLYLLVLWISVPLIIPFLISLYLTPIYQVRYAVGGACAFFILVAKGVDSLSNKKIKFLIIIVIVILSLNNLRHYYNVIDKHQWREAVSYLESETQPGELIFVSPDYEVKSGLYHLTRDDLLVRGFSKESLSELDKDNYGFWVIMSWHGEFGKESLTYELLKNYNVKSRKDFHKLKIYRYQN